MGANILQSFNFIQFVREIKPSEALTKDTWCFNFIQFVREIKPDGAQTYKYSSFNFIQFVREIKPQIHFNKKKSNYNRSTQWKKINYLNHIFEKTTKNLTKSFFKNYFFKNKVSLG